MELGTVISTMDGPTTTLFSFVITQANVRKGQFVQTQTEDGLLIGMVTEITRANRYFERAESVAEYERSGMPGSGGMGAGSAGALLGAGGAGAAASGITANFPTKDWEYVIANVKALGIYKEKLLSRSSFPAAPGARVLAADEKLLTEFLGFVDDGLNIGKLQNHNVEVKLKLNRLLQKHLAILGMSGSGKSYCTASLIEELLDRKKELGRMAVIVIDVHGEYIGFKQSAYGDRTNIFDGKKIRIALRKLSPQMLAEFMPDLSPPQKRLLGKTLNEMKFESKQKHEAFDLDDLVGRIESEGGEKESALRSVLCAWLQDLKGVRIIGKVDNPKMEELAVAGKLAVVDLSDIDSMKRKQLIVAYFGKKLFTARKKGKIPPFAFMVEEAHNFATEKAPKGSSLSKGIIETMAREGRKFGASLCLITQRPVKLSTTALSQCNSNIIMRITNPFDIKHIGESCEGIDYNMQNSITSLRTGEGIIIGEAANHPVFIKVRARKSKCPPKGESLEKLAAEYEKAHEKKKEDVEAFL